MAQKNFSLKKLALFEIAKLFWNASFKSEDLQLSEIKDDFERKWEIRLTNTRKEAIYKIDAFIRNRKLPTTFKPALRQNIFLLNRAYHQIALWKIAYDTENKIDLLQKGELYAPNYFTLNGEFDDIAWTKRFVLNPNYSVADRFSFACFYWFENECATLWTEFKYIYDSPYEYFISKSMSSFMILHLEFDLITADDDDWRAEVSFWKACFEYGIEQGYEHATYYFWEKMPESEKIAIIENDRFFDLMSIDTNYPNDKICTFLFYLLSRERKEDLIIWSIENNRLEIWQNLFLSPNNEIDISELLHYYTHVPSEMYSDILQVLARKIQQLQLPFDIQMFHLLWHNLTPTQKIHTLESSSLFLETLAKAKSFCNLSHIIKSLSLEQSDKCLLINHYEAGVSILKIFLEDCEFDLFQKYLSLFLIEKDSLTENGTLRKDAIEFLEMFIQSLNYKLLCKEEFSKIEEIENRIDFLQTSLTLLDELCEKVCEEFSLSSSPLKVSVYQTHFAENKVIIPTVTSSSSQKRKFEEDTKPAKLQKSCTPET